MEKSWKLIFLKEWSPCITSLCVLGGYENEPTCGRPLGMRLDADGYLIVCDTTLGLYKINVATGLCSCFVIQSFYLCEM